jgi:hypothetical protein
MDAGVTDMLWEIGDVVNVFEDWKNNTRYVPAHHHLHSITGTVYWSADD